MTSNPHPGMPEAWVDRADLDDIFRDAKPIGDGSEWTVPGFFESDDEHAEFLGWLQADRAISIAWVQRMRIVVDTDVAPSFLKGSLAPDFRAEGALAFAADGNYRAARNEWADDCL